MEKRLYLFAKASLILVYLVIVAGALVRMTGSGMGCQIGLNALDITYPLPLKKPYNGKLTETLKKVRLLFTSRDFWLPYPILPLLMR